MGCGCGTRAMRLFRWFGWAIDRSYPVGFTFEREAEVIMSVSFDTVRKHHVRATLLLFAVQLLFGNRRK